MEIQKYYVIFVYILQGKIGKTEKNRKENYATKVTKNQKMKIWDERNKKNTGVEKITDSKRYPLPP